LVEVGEAGIDVAAGGVEWSAFGIVEEQVVDGDVEGLGPCAAGC